MGPQNLPPGSGPDAAAAERPPRTPWMGFAVATGVALLIGIFLPWILEPDPLLVSARVVTPAGTLPSDGEFNSGDEFCIDLELGRSATILVIFVGSDAAFSILEPPPGGAIRVYEEGEGVRIPCLREGRSWRLDDTPGTERLVIGAFPPDEAPKGPIVERLKKGAAEAGPDPGAKVTAVMSLLMTEGAEVSLLPFEHKP